MSKLDKLKQAPFGPPRQTDTSTPSPPPAPEETEPLAVPASREEERREEQREERREEQQEEQREVPRKVQPPVKQTCDRCWQTPETWEESPCEYNDRVRVTCSVCGKFIGYRILERKPR